MNFNSHSHSTPAFSLSSFLIANFYLVVADSAHTRTFRAATEYRLELCLDSLSVFSLLLLASLLSLLGFDFHAKARLRNSLEVSKLRSCTKSNQKSIQRSVGHFRVILMRTLDDATLLCRRSFDLLAEKKRHRWR